MAGDIKNKIVSAIPTTQQNKDAINTISDKVINMIPDRTISSLIKSPTALPQKGPIGGLADKPETFPLAGKIPTFRLSGWDKFKNFLSRTGEKFGLKTHLITEKDY